jgi:PAS domain S-box-containing protein
MGRQMQSLEATAEPSPPLVAPEDRRAPRRWLTRPDHWRLASRLTLAVVAMAIPLELIILWTAITGIEERRAAELENAVLVGQALAAVVDGFARDLQSTTFAVATSLGAQPGPLDQDTAGGLLAVVAEQYPDVRALFLTDAQGRLIATGTGGALGFDLSARPYIQELRAGARTVWSGGIAGVQTGETTVAFGRVVSGPADVPRAFLIAAFYPQIFVGQLPITLPGDARVTVIDDRGVALYHSDPDSVPGAVGDSAAVQAALRGETVRIVGQEPLNPGEPRFGALVPIPRLRWTVAYTLPHASIEATLAERAIFQAGGIGLVILLAAGLMIVLARRLTRPLTMLAETADAITRGEQPAVPDIASAAEVERLATAMRIMSSAVAEREDALLAQREWLRVTLASIGDAVVATDATGRLTFMNIPAATLTGWSEQEALGRNVQETFQLRNEQTGRPVDSPIERVLREGVVVGLANHTILETRDGTMLPIDDSAAPIRDGAGALIGVVMVFRDVTERRRAEEILHDSQQRLELAVQAARMVAWEWDPVTDRVSTSANLPEVYGISAIEGAEQAFGMLHPDDLAAHRAAIQAAIGSGGGYRSEFRVIRPDTGEIEWREERGLAVTDENGTLRKLHGIVMDTTQRQVAEQALRESEGRLRLAVEAAPVVLFNHDRDLRYTWAARSLAGLTPEALIGKTDAELFPPAVAEPAMTLKRRALEKNERVEGEIEAPSAPGSPPQVWELTVEPLRDETGAVVGITCAALDVTERRALEKLQQEFISLVSHELRNPLSSIKGYAQLVLRRGELQERAVRSIVQQSDHLDRLISDLLDSSRLETGRLELRRRRIDLLDVTAACVERAQTQTEIHTIRLEADNEQYVGVWDPERLDQVFSNVLSNAVKYSPEGGEIVVRVEGDDREVGIAIRDHGLGIEPDQLARLFDRFYRITATAESIQGLGIGLYVARELVEAHGGRMWAESDGAGLGTTFHVTLPLELEAASERDDGQTVLVVDDDETLRELIADTLRGEGYRLMTARDGLEALDRVEAEPPALILLDWMMPRLDGAGFATELRRRFPEVAVPILVMTAGGVAQARAASIDADGFIAKPFELDLLLDQVARHLERRATT